MASRCLQVRGKWTRGQTLILTDQGLTQFTILVASVPGHHQVCPLASPQMSLELSLTSVQSEASRHEGARGEE